MKVKIELASTVVIMKDDCMQEDEVEIFVDGKSAYVNIEQLKLALRKITAK